jgi:PelA/Pel-15E family pectate lyase
VILVPDINAPKGMDRRMVADPNAEPFWARYYELGTNKPMFVGRDSLPKYSISELSYAQRNSYAWFGRWPAKLLDVDYPVWHQKCMAVKSLPKK